MAHFAVMVIGDNPEEQLSVFDEYWDWYELGGRWTGFLKIKEGCNATVGERGLNSIVGGQDIFVPPAKPNFADAALKRDIDNEFMRKAKADKADRAYDEDMNVNLNITKEEYIENARNRSISTFAVLKDGEWYEQGMMGLCAPIGVQQDQIEWDKLVTKLFNETSDDTLISIYDCHC